MSRESVKNHSRPVFGLVLAGGRSRRFGRDKAGIEIGGQDVLSRIVAVVNLCCDRVFVSVSADQIDEALRKRHDLIVDKQPELGPAGGILAAHTHCADVAWFVTACDMPLLDEGSIRRLIDLRRAEKAGIGYRGSGDGRPEPLCAIWEPATLQAFQHRVESGGSLSPRDMLVDAGIELIDVADDRVLANVNTPADFDRLDSEGFDS